ncbi:DASH family cryptochrome [Pseudoalteromonas sp. T1lg76]|uniref:DASH family cryptochrome n=1 Tax=Pseudoalteromonas sp. T1lg76 TaxID=2077103 RepID=UPI000CF738F1|nr:DASH family cryptochrome [Pseudoalteromonas sp. T1lg76]
MSTGLYLFSNDLRIADNELLQRLCQHCKQLIFIYTPLNELVGASYNAYPKQDVSKSVCSFRGQTLKCLADELSRQGHNLYFADSIEDLVRIIREHKVSDIAIANQFGWNESLALRKLTQQVRGINFWHKSNHTLFAKEQLPFQIDDTPDTFSRFRKLVESSVAVHPTMGSPLHFPTSVQCKLPLCTDIYNDLQPMGAWFSQTATTALTSYFSSTSPSRYKQTRNALWGDKFSTGLSPWLANGSLSARQMYMALIKYENKYGANESTYWIYFELLWREYFQWLALKQGRSLFVFKGMNHTAPKTSFYPERYQAWCHGNTEFELVNALMHQLNTSGWMSNRGRQIVASCFVNELELDWRYGAAYFEHHLIDYDVASNYGNWQYIAGVGADPRGGRHFNIAKQTELFDPDGRFIKRYGGVAVQAQERDHNGWPRH